ncbi:hypothetical protein COCCADRAFT_31288 [Bipolaris zeicola 26-R-13]|uniref:ABC transporter domain-containing protein n=1 Tax=Cochliobolus carbonum (strain 26-R-13) TaxID=930089 RepID=W6XNU2_COCC2|nr:uncharacterized protein COCCADRAFT_31288 [Bipolaris zeicola 26-R-13]EUC27158.1 hypothetical protein COCCADRAFT_31288 [Bipolaris zeicola 26-R-13]
MASTTIISPDMPTSPFDATLTLMINIQAPVVGFYYLGACSFGLCVLQKTQMVSQKRRISIVAFMVTILLAYITEALYYLSRSIADSEYAAPQFFAIRCLGSMLVWSPLSCTLWASKSLRWHAYFGVFVVQFAFEATTCFITISTVPEPFSEKYPPLIINCVRALVSLLLLLDAFVVLVTKQTKVSTDSERQSLLNKSTNSSHMDYSAIPFDGDSSDDEDALPDEDDKDLKAQQAKRLEEEGGWFGYLKGFAVFLPYLFPKDDWKVMACLGIRLVHVLLERALNLLTPRQLGIITTELQKAYDTKSGVIPWKDIGLWVLYSWINSYAGLGVIDGMANLVISNSAYRGVTLLAYEHVLGLSMDFHTSKDSGEVLKAVEQASSLNTLIETLLFNVAPILLDLFVAMYYVTHLFDAYMAFIVLYMGTAYIAIGFYFTTLSQPKRRHYVEKQRSESSTVNETIRNWQTVAYFNRFAHECKRHAENINDTISAQYQYYSRSMGQHAAQNLLTTLGLSGACVFGMTQIVTGRKPIGNLVTLIMYWHTMTSPLYALSYSFRQTTSSLIDAERLLQLLNTKPTVADQEGAKEIVVVKGEVEFKDVHFHYDERKPTIKNVNFKASGGQTIAFVGETGGGKSTMLKLLFRFYDITSGSIIIDGQDLLSVTQDSLRDALGVVPQDPDLFNQSIRQNIRYSKLDATDAEIEDACRAAAIHDDIVSFPDGYNSKVGERGVRLSGGQLQRIAIARVLLKNPKIVLLDEATSAIDSSTEAHIQEALRKLTQGRTTFVIAHRLSTIVNADQILVMNKGEIVERGTHQELLRNAGGEYTKLWRRDE